MSEPRPRDPLYLVQVPLPCQGLQLYLQHALLLPAPRRWWVVTMTTTGTGESGETLIIIHLDI